MDSFNRIGVLRVLKAVGAAAVCAILVNLLACGDTSRQEGITPLSADGRIGRLLVWSGPIDSLEWETYVVEIEDIASNRYRIIDTLPDWTGGSGAVDIYYCDSVSVVYVDCFHDDTARLVVRRFVPPKYSHTFAILPLRDSLGNWQAGGHIHSVLLRDSLVVSTDSLGVAIESARGSEGLQEIRRFPKCAHPVLSGDGKQVLFWQCHPDWINCERWTLFVHDMVGDSTYSLLESSAMHELYVQRRSVESPVFFVDTPDSTHSQDLYYRVESMDTTVQVTHYEGPEYVSYFWLMEDSIALWINRYGKPLGEQRVEIIRMPGK